MKLKYLVAALAFVAAGSANATITLSSTGNSELLFNVWYTAGTADTSDDRSYSRDLAGLDMATFLGATNAPLAAAINVNTSYSFAADANFTSFLSYVDGQAALGSAGRGSMLWNVVAADNNGADRLLTTAAVAGPTLTRAKLRDSTTLGFDFFAPKINAVSGNEVSTMASDADGSVIATASDDGYALTNFGSAFKTNLAGWNTAAAYGQSMDFHLLFETSGTGTGNATYGNFNNGDNNGDLINDNDHHQWTLAGDTLTYAAPVPEADTYALLLAGMGLVGFMARRRKV